MKYFIVSDVRGRGVLRKTRRVRHFHKHPGGGLRRHLQRLARTLIVHQQGIGGGRAGSVGKGAFLLQFFHSFFRVDTSRSGWLRMMRANELGVPEVFSPSCPSARACRMRAGYHSTGSAMARRSCMHGSACGRGGDAGGMARRGDVRSGSGWAGVKR